MTTLTVLTLVGCDEYVSFREPQPQNDRNEKRFDSNIRGTYLSLEDSSLLVIDELSVRSYGRKKDKPVDKEGVDINITLDKATFDMSLNNRSETSVFFLDQDHILKKFKGHYFMNSRRDDGRWNLLIMRKSDGLMTIKNIEMEERTIRQLNSLTVVDEVLDRDGDTEGFILNPTKKEMKSMLKSDIFETEVYKKLE